MNIKFEPSFFKSLKRLSTHNKFYYKFYSFFRRDLWWFLKTLLFFRKELFLFRPWDYTYTLAFLKRSIELQCDYIEKYGYEVEVERLKKVRAMRIVVSLLENQINNSYLRMSENKLNNKYDTSYLFSIEREPENIKINNKKISDLAFDIEKTEWDELFDILKGCNAKDGSDIRTWWD